MDGYSLNGKVALVTGAPAALYGPVAADRAAR